VALAVAILVALLPRPGWLIAAVGFVSWLGWDLRDGTALVVGIALLTPPLLAPRAERGWSLPALAPLLGAIAVAPLYAAVTGLASSAWRRAGLAAAGFAWLAIAEVVTSDRLLIGPPDEATARAAWQGSIGRAASDGLLPLVTSGILLGAAVWALAAATLPLLVRGRSLALDVAGAVLWAALLVVAQRGVVEVAGSHLPGGPSHGMTVGAVLGAAAAVGARAAGLWPASGERPDVP
jgi:hypothetical protein